MEIALAMRASIGGGLAMGFLMRVVDLQRKDGEAIDDEAGGLGVEGSGRVLGGERTEESLIDLLDQVVAILVETIDRVFDGGDVLGCGAHVAGEIFLMPEVEVGTMLGKDGGHQAGGWRDEVVLRDLKRVASGGDVCRREVGGMIVPELGGAIVTSSYPVCVDHVPLDEGAAE